MEQAKTKKRKPQSDSNKGSKKQKPTKPKAKSPEAKKESAPKDEQNPTFLSLPNKNWEIKEEIWRSPHVFSKEEAKALSDSEVRMHHFSKLLVRHKPSGSVCFELMYRTNEKNKTHLSVPKSKQVNAFKKMRFVGGDIPNKKMIAILRNRLPRSKTEFGKQHEICGFISDRWAQTLEEFKYYSCTYKEMAKKPHKFSSCAKFNFSQPPVPEEIYYKGEDVKESEHSESESSSSSSSMSDSVMGEPEIGPVEQSLHQASLNKAVTDAMDEVGDTDSKATIVRIPDTAEQDDFNEYIDKTNLALVIDRAKSTMASTDLKLTDKPPQQPPKKEKKRDASPKPKKARQEKAPKKAAKAKEPTKSPKKSAPKAASKKEISNAESLTVSLTKASALTKGKFPLGTKNNVSAESVSKLYTKLSEEGKLDKHMNKDLVEKLRTQKFTLEELFNSTLLRKHALPLFYCLDAFAEEVDIFPKVAAAAELDQIMHIHLAGFQNLKEGDFDSWHLNLEKIFKAIRNIKEPDFLSEGTFVEHWKRIGPWALGKRLGGDIAQMFYSEEAIVRCWSGFFTEKEIGEYKKSLFANRKDLLAVMHVWDKDYARDEAEAKEESESSSDEDDLMNCM